MKQQLDLLSAHRCFGGKQMVYEHDSTVLNFRMRFGIYVPEDLEEPAPILYHLSGMSCSEQTFIQKTGFQRWASHYRIIVVSPDICPRTTFGVEKNEIEAKGLSFYVNAEKKPWDMHYHMFSYINEELPGIIQEYFKINKDRQSIMGHRASGIVCWTATSEKDMLNMHIMVNTRHRPRDTTEPSQS